MYLCIYVSIYVSMYRCIYVSMYLSIYVYIYVSIYLCIYLSMYLCIYVSMYQLLSFLTHIQGKTLDLLFTNLDNHIKNISTTTHSTLQFDHLIILFDINCSFHSHKQPPRYVYNLSKDSLIGLNNHLLDSNLILILS